MQSNIVVMCPLVFQDNGLWKCPQCGWVYKLRSDKPPRRNCPNAPDLIPIAHRLAEETGDPTILDKVGPGTELLKLLRAPVKALAWLPYVSRDGCAESCERYAQEMDRWGAAGCRQQFAAIVDHLEAHAKKLGMPFSRRAAEMFVRWAIRRAEKKAAA